VKPAANYTRVCGTIPTGLNADGNMGLDANDDFMYFRVNGPGNGAAVRRPDAAEGLRSPGMVPARAGCAA